MFADRTEAGERLGEFLLERDVRADVVLAVPRGGLPAGRAVADALGVPLDVVVARKMGAPDNPELAIGAVAADGSVWLNDDIIDRLGVDEEYVERERAKQAEAAREKRDRYRGDREPPAIEGMRVLVVDDGVATGATITACLRSLRTAGAAWIGLAVPVAPPDTAARLRDEADAVYAVRTPDSFGAVGQYYRNFSQVSDAEAREYLDPDRTLPGGDEDGSGQ